MSSLEYPTMSMNKTWPISNFTAKESELIGFTSISLRKVFGSADHSGADRTSDRAGAARESAARLKRVRPRMELRVVFVKRRWRGRGFLTAPPPGLGSRSEGDHPSRLS